MQSKDTKIWDAISYSANSELQYVASKKLLSTHNFKGNEKILDIGCGHGRLTQEIAKLVPNCRVIGIDNSESMIEYAKTHHFEKNLQYKLMDAQSFTFTEKFDVIISTFCLQWTADKMLVFRNIANHLIGNGYIFLIMPFRNEDLAQIRNHIMQKIDWNKYFENYNDPSLALLDNDYALYAKEAGFLNISYQLETITTEFKNILDLTAFLINITPCIVQLPNETLKKHFMNQLINQYLIKCPAKEDGSCEISYTYAKLYAKG